MNILFGGIMTIIEVLTLLFLGIIIGSGFLWFMLRQKIKDSYNLGQSAVISEKAVLEERLIARDQIITELRSEEIDNGKKIDTLTNELKSETEKRSKAEEKNLRIPELETTIGQKEGDIAELND